VRPDRPHLLRPCPATHSRAEPTLASNQLQRLPPRLRTVGPGFRRSLSTSTRWSKAAAPRDASAPRSHRSADRLEAGGDPASALPSHLLRGPAADAGSGGAGEHVRGEPRTRARQRGHGTPRVVAPGYLRHRPEVVEFRVEQHFERLGDQLRRLGFVITSDIKDGAGEEIEDPRDTEVSTGKDLPEWARRDSNARPLAPEAPEASDGQRPSA
jgi:hypothetical protein